MSQEAPDTTDDVGHMPSLSSKSRETGESQDMYRHTLAASWAAQPGELKADECIEDIFAGGDGWGSHLHHTGHHSSTPTPAQSSLNVQHDYYRHSDDDSGSRSTSSTNLAAKFGRGKAKGSPKHKGNTTPHVNYAQDDRSKLTEGTGLRHMAVSGRTSLAQQAKKMVKMNKERSEPQGNEIHEFDNPYREDLRSWKIRDTSIT